MTLNNIRYVYYKETDKILGNTFGMCILQDFEAITPNLLARTIETVEGGGLVLLLLKGMKSLKQLYTLSMDIHSRYRTEAHNDVIARFNERFILSLGSCESCLVVDDELNVLPISGGKSIAPLAPPDPDHEGKTKIQKDLEEIKQQNLGSQPTGSLVTLAKTADQAKAVLKFIEAISEKTLRSTVTLTAARGRGKSAALGIAIAAAIAYGYSNIFITSPSPENLKTLFEFVFKGFDALNYLDHVDYTIIQSTNPSFNKAIVRVNVHRQHRQTIQYIQPQDAYTLGQAELLIIDEAAAIPLPLVKKLMGPYLVFMASTINGYEGTGRSLSLKLIQQLREQSRALPKETGMDQGNVADRKSGKPSRSVDKGTPGGRNLREITLSEPIRYAPGDLVEKWLNKLLCLDATLPRSMANTLGCPHPNECQLLQVNRDTLFSFHPVSEKFLDQMLALYVASHYKNSPNDLQLMSDAPAHQLYVLVPPVEDDSTRLPDPLCVLQVALEGQISKQSVLNSLSRGQRVDGDLIPWVISQQFQDEDFASLSGARVIRIATNPDYINMGYGSRALSLLTDFYENKFMDLSETEVQAPQQIQRVTDAELEESALLVDNIKVRDINSMPPLFSKLSECRPTQLDYVGVSYGLTRPLHKFWKRAGYAPVYLRQTANELTGEHSCIMMRTLSTSEQDPAWLGAFARDFQKRFHSLLGFQFREFESVLSLSIDESASNGAKLDTTSPPMPLTKAELDAVFSPFDLKRLDSYANNMLDYHVILDMVPTMASLYLSGRLKYAVKLSGVQSAILLAIGLQRKVLEDVGKELTLEVSQLLAMFVKTIRKFSTHFRELVEGAVIETMPENETNGKEDAHHGDGVADETETQLGKAGALRFQPLTQSLTDELREGKIEVDKELREKQRALIDALPLDKYEIGELAPGWAEAEDQVQRTLSKKGGANGDAPTVSVKTKKRPDKRKGDTTAEELWQEENTKREAELRGKKIKKGKPR